MSKLNHALRWISYGLAILALAAGIALLIGDAILRPGFADLLKNALLAATFLLWGVIQLMPQNAASKRLGNLVIALYVLDLAWVVLGTRISPKRN